MRPPAPTNWLSSYGFGKRRDRSARGLEYHAVLTNESEGLT
jgi:hypothetical protein